MDNVQEKHLDEQRSLDGYITELKDEIKSLEGAIYAANAMVIVFMQKTGLNSITINKDECIDILSKYGVDGVIEEDTITFVCHELETADDNNSTVDSDSIS